MSIRNRQWAAEGIKTMAQKRLLKGIFGALILGISLAFLWNPMSAPGQPRQANASQGLPPPRVLLPDQSGQISQPTLPPVVDTQPHVSMKQKDAIVRANFKKTKDDVSKLFKLTQALQEEIGKSNPNVLSLSIVGKADEIEKLAKKIKNEAKAY